MVNITFRGRNAQEQEHSNQIIRTFLQTGRLLDAMEDRKRVILEKVSKLSDAQFREEFMKLSISCLGF